MFNPIVSLFRHSMNRQCVCLNVIFGGEILLELARSELQWMVRENVCDAVTAKTITISRKDARSCCVGLSKREKQREREKKNPSNAVNKTNSQQKVLN